MILQQQRAEPIHGGNRGADARADGLARRLDHDDRKTETAGGYDLRVGGCSARVLGNDDIDGLRLQKFDLRFDVERATLQELSLIHI